MGSPDIESDNDVGRALHGHIHDGDLEIWERTADFGDGFADAVESRVRAVIERRDAEDVAIGSKDGRDDVQIPCVERFFQESADNELERDHGFGLVSQRGLAARAIADRARSGGVFFELDPKLSPGEWDVEGQSARPYDGRADLGFERRDQEVFDLADLGNVDALGLHVDVPFESGHFWKEQLPFGSRLPNRGWRSIDGHTAIQFL